MCWYSLGTSAAYFYSLYLTIQWSSMADGMHHGSHPWIMKRVRSLLHWFLLGKLFESLAKGRTSEAIKSLMSLQAKTALVVRDGFKELTIPVDEVIVGDVVLIRPGDKVPVDGEVLEGIFICR